MVGEKIVPRITILGFYEVFFFNVGRATGGIKRVERSSKYCEIIISRVLIRDQTKYNFMGFKSSAREPVDGEWKRKRKRRVKKKKKWHIVEIVSVKVRQIFWFSAWVEDRVVRRHGASSFRISGIQGIRDSARKTDYLGWVKVGARLQRKLIGSHICIQHPASSGSYGSALTASPRLIAS